MAPCCVASLTYSESKSPVNSSQQYGSAWSSETSALLCHIHLHICMSLNMLVPSYLTTRLHLEGLILIRVSSRHLKDMNYHPQMIHFLKLRTTFSPSQTLPYCGLNLICCSTCVCSVFCKSMHTACLAVLYSIYK